MAARAAPLHIGGGGSDTFWIDAGDVQTSASGSNTLIDVDITNDGVSDFQITLVIAPAPAGAHYIF